MVMKAVSADLAHKSAEVGGVMLNVEDTAAAYTQLSKSADLLMEER